jgi:hypothetical protein
MLQFLQGGMILYRIQQYFPIFKANTNLFLLKARNDLNDNRGELRFVVGTNRDIVFYIIDDHILSVDDNILTIREVNLVAIRRWGSESVVCLGDDETQWIVSSQCEILALRDLCGMNSVGQYFMNDGEWS